MATFVSAFISNANNRHDRNEEKYIELGNNFIIMPVNKIIFIEKHIYEKYYANNNNYNKENTKFILFEKTENYLYNYKDKITNFNLATDNKNKDTLEYCFLICHKTEWVKKAIELNIFKSEQFIWIDFGIYHIFKNEDRFKNSVLNAEKKIYEKIRIGSCWNLTMQYARDIYSIINWYFAGGVFGGSKNYLLAFADFMKQKCFSIINEKKTIMWEVNIWYIIYKDIPYLFDPYQSNHDPSLIENY